MLCWAPQLSGSFLRATGACSCLPAPLMRCWENFPALPHSAAGACALLCHQLAVWPWATPMPSLDLTLTLTKRKLRGYAQLAHPCSPSSLGEKSKNRRTHQDWRPEGEWSGAEMPKIPWMGSEVHPAAPAKSWGDCGPYEQLGDNLMRVRSTQLRHPQILILEKLCEIINEY